MNMNEYKRNLLYRKAQCKVHKDKYLNKIHSFINVTVDNNKFLDLEETDNIINELNSREIKTKKSIKNENYKQLVKLIETKVSGGSFYLLIDEEWKYCGAYKADGKLSEYFDFDEFQSDEIRIIDYDYAFQFQIDYEDGEIECELIVYR